MTICNSCQQKTTVEEIKGNIWDFNPYSYETYYDMKKSFRILIDKNIRNIKKFYNIHNEDGYTYSQWYVYVISKNSYKCKKLYKKTWWLMDIMSRFSFFRNLIKLGKKDDKKHNSLHHFLKYLDNYNNSFYQNRVINLFLDCGLDLNDEDSDGISGYDYINEKMLSLDDLENTRKCTKIYKNSEDLLKEIIYKKLDEQLEKCEICSDILNIYGDMLKYKEELVDVYHNNKELIKNIIKYRKDCINIYEKYPTMKFGTDRHHHIVDMYKNIFDLQDINE